MAAALATPPAALHSGPIRRTRVVAFSSGPHKAGTGRQQPAVGAAAVAARPPAPAPAAASAGGERTSRRAALAALVAGIAAVKAAPAAADEAASRQGEVSTHVWWVAAYAGPLHHARSNPCPNRI